MNWLKWITHAKEVITFFKKNYEHIKSIALTFLIGLSLVLTWSLWTFKPSYPSLEGARIVKKQEVDVQAEVKQLVYPTQVIYHSGDDLYGLEANSLIRDFHMGLNETKFMFDTGAKSSRSFDPDEKFLRDNKYVEIIYPTGISQDIYKEIFSFETDVQGKLPKMDRIFLYQDKLTDSIEGYLVSYQAPRKMQKITASNNKLNPLIKNMDEWVENGSFTPYINYDVETADKEGQAEVTKRYYFPKNSVELSRYTYFSNSTGEDTYEMYKKALFKDPLAVKSASDKNQITYADGTAAMVVNEVTNRFTYTNFSGNRNQNAPPNISPLYQSKDYINTHAGWGNPYILSDLTGDSAGFWLFIENLPVLDPEMQMSLVWLENELKEYQRSLTQLQLGQKPDLSQKMTIQSGLEVIKELEEKEYNMNYIQDIRIGLTMKKQKQPHIYRLEPQWFINSNIDSKGWRPLFTETGKEGF
ncbi:two-component system activity regulator YycH [Bacillus sp. E(2018)]|uniref:YycH family regulatory protein n=1 Tax=Bacillus sp. E(2018) TaxID=2502239 RepID=UPI0010F7AECC|nr:two-component system activity regulator YycH [Bacillus sp. E(2018)]